MAITVHLTSLSQPRITHGWDDIVAMVRDGDKLLSYYGYFELALERQL